MKFGWQEYIYFYGIKRRWCRFFGYPFIHSQVVARYVLQNVHFQNKNILDIACGDGVFSHHLAKHYNASVFGIDRLCSRIHNAKCVADFFSLKNTFECITIDDYLNKNKNLHQFNIILTIDCLEHLQKPFNILERMTDRITPGTLLIINTPRLHQHRFFLKNNREEFEYGEDRHYVNGFEIEDLKNELTSLNYHIIYARHIFFYLYQFVWECTKFLKHINFLFPIFYPPLFFLALLDRFIPIGNGNGIFIIAQKI